MAEKFRKIVNAPHKAFGRARKNIAKMTPTTKKGKAARVAGVAMTGMFQFLLWAVKYATLDNHATRAMERGFANMTVGKNKDGKDKKLSAFAKKYPNLSSHMLYYMMLGAAAIAAPHAYDALTNEGDANDKIESMAEIPFGQPGTYGAYLDRMRSITPLLIADLIAKEGVHMDDQGRHTPYKDSNGIPTIGFGSTVLKDGSKVTMKTPPISTEEAYELARWHLEQGETYFVMYCYDVAMEKVNINTTSEAFGMASIVYNSYSKLIENPKDKSHKKRFEKLREIYDQYGLATPDSLVMDAFAQYPVKDMRSFGEKWLGGAPVQTTANMLGNFLADGRGMYWRRWLEAGMLTGDITPEMMLDCPANGMYEFFKVMKEKKSAFFIGDGEKRRVNKETYARFKEWLANPVNERGERLGEKNFPRVRNLLPADVRIMCESGHCKLGDVEFIAQFTATPAQQEAETASYVIGYDEQYRQAVGAFRAGDYDGALAQYLKMAEEYPNNALIHNDLAATYNQLGRYDDAIKHARIIINEIGDKSQYGAAQYNAGFAYEQKGDLQKALANYKLALANGNRRVQKDITRVSGQLKSQQNGRGKKSAKTAYMRGAKKLGNNAHSADFDVLGATTRGGHGMA